VQVQHIAFGVCVALFYLSPNLNLALMGAKNFCEKMVEIYFCHGSGCGQLQGQAIHDGLDQARTNVDDRMMPVRQCSRNCTMSWREF